MADKETLALLYTEKRSDGRLQWRARIIPPKQAKYLGGMMIYLTDK